MTGDSGLVARVATSATDIGGLPLSPFRRHVPTDGHWSRCSNDRSWRFEDIAKATNVGSLITEVVILSSSVGGLLARDAVSAIGASTLVTRDAARWLPTVLFSLDFLLFLYFHIAMYLL